MESAKNLNLALLWDQYRGAKAARRGYELLHGLIRGDQRKKLDHLLRDHSLDYISNTQTYKRDDVDQLINAYMVLMVAILSRRVPAELPTEISDEIVEILGDPSVVRYYTKQYPLVLPQLLFAYASDSKKRDRVLSAIRTITESRSFDDFMWVDREIETDEDVNTFLGLMDDYKFDGVGIGKLMSLVSHPERLTRKLAVPDAEDDTLAMAARGFLKYVELLAEYRALLEGSAEQPILASTFWHKQGYWFDAIGDAFETRMLNLLTNLNLAVRRTSAIVIGVEMTEDEKSQLEEQTTEAARQATDNFTFIFQRQWKTPLLELLNDHGPLGPTGSGGPSIPTSPLVPVGLGTL